MLVELRVRDLGVIEDLSLVFGPGLTAVTGETGAGKTLVVEALALLAGTRAEPGVVRAGAAEAVVEGRFDTGDGEVVVGRVVPAAGRSRAYLDGGMVTAATMSERMAGLLDLHGQHGHQRLLSATAQRGLVDSVGGVDLVPLLAARDALRSVASELAALGGDARARAREIDLLRHQVAEIAAANVTSVDEDADLEALEERLADAAGLRDAAHAAYEALRGDQGAQDRAAAAMAVLTGRAAAEAFHERLRGLVADLDDVAAELRAFADSLDDDPQRLEDVRARRNLLRDLRRKYGADLTEVVRFRDEAAARLAELESWDERAAELEAERTRRAERLTQAERAVAEDRQRAATELAVAVESRARELALPGARFVIDVGEEGAGDEVTFRFSANPGEPPAPLARVASGGELARIMLALRLVATERGDRGGSGLPTTLVFDEVDAGVGGEAASAVGRALAALAPTFQVLVVTHLAQVAAFADEHVGVRKEVAAGRTVATARALRDAERVAELSRMLAGQPDSRHAQRHAEELLADAAVRRRPTREVTK